MDYFKIKMPNGLKYNCQMKDQNISCTYSSKQNFSSTEIITSNYKPKLEKVEQSPCYMHKRFTCPYGKDCPRRKQGMHSMHGMDMPCKYDQTNCPYRRGINMGGRWDATGYFTNTE